jgi:hypothetical protein
MPSQQFGSLGHPLYEPHFENPTPRHANLNPRLYYTIPAGARLENMDEGGAEISSGFVGTYSHNHHKIDL